MAAFAVDADGSDVNRFKQQTAENRWSETWVMITSFKT